VNIHLNPVDAGIVETCGRLFIWSWLKNKVENLKYKWGAVANF